MGTLERLLTLSLGNTILQRLDTHMGMFDRFFKRELNTSRATVEVSPATSDGSIWAEQGPAITGINVTENAALNVATVYSCVSLRSQIMASLPICCYKKQNDSRIVADQHPAHWLWNRTTDDYLNAFNSRETLEGHKLLRGNAYYEIGRNYRGQAMKVWLLDPRRMSIVTPTGSDFKDISQHDPSAKIYVYSELKGPPTKMDHTEVCHFANWSMDGFYGVAPLTVFRESLGLTLAANQYASQFFRKGGYPLGFLTKPGNISPDVKKTLQREWAEWHGGLGNSHQIGLLGGGMDWKNIGISNNDAQLLGLRQFQKYEMAMLYRVPPILIGDVEQPTANIESILIQFVMFSILPEMKRNENELNNKMFTPKEQFTYYMEYNADGLLRGDAKSRAESLQTQLRNGALTINEWRQMENRDKVEYGDITLLMASQLATLQAVAEGKTNLDTTSPGGTNNRTSTGKDKTKQNEQQHAVDQLIIQYLALSEEDRRRVADSIYALSTKATV